MNKLTVTLFKTVFEKRVQCYAMNFDCTMILCKFFNDICTCFSLQNGKHPLPYPFPKRKGESMKAKRFACKKDF
jgi:hypothetical protein